MTNKALEWIRNKVKMGYVPKFKSGDVIFAKNSDFTLLALVKEVHKRETAKREDRMQGEYILSYIVNNKRSSKGLEYPIAKDIISIDSKYQVCNNPEMFKTLYGIRG